MQTERSTELCCGRRSLGGRDLGELRCWKLRKSGGQPGAGKAEFTGGGRWGVGDGG